MPASLTEAAVAEQQTATALSAEAKQWRQLRSADESKAQQAPGIARDGRDGGASGDGGTLEDLTC